MNVLNYQLYCSVCKHDYDSSVEWIAHLSKIDHQRRARLACRRWNKFTKECVLVAFSSCPIAECGLEQRLSSWPNHLVTDFVWWKKKPNVGLVQFESKIKVEEILKCTKSEIQIDDTNRVQLKKAVDYLELEWNVLLSLKVDARLEPDVFTGGLHDLVSVKKETYSELDSLVPDSAQRKRLTGCINGVSDMTSKKAKKTKSTASKKRSIIESEPELAPLETSSNVGDGKKHPKRVKKTKSAKSNKDVVAAKKVKKTKSSTKNVEDKRGTKRIKRVEVKDLQEVPSLGPLTYGGNDESGATILPEATDLSRLNSSNSGIEPAEEEVCTVEIERTGRSNETVTDEDYAVNSNELDIPTNLSREIGEYEEYVSVNASKSTADSRSITQNEADSNAEIVDLISDSDNENENNIITNIGYQKRTKKYNTKGGVNLISLQSKMSEVLRKQYASIFQDILIPQETFNTALYLKNLLEKEFKKTVPCCKVLLFRHYYLGIQNCGNNELLLFVDYQRNSEGGKPPVISNFFEFPSKIFPDIQKLPKKAVKNKYNKNNQATESIGVGFLHKPSGLIFRVIPSIFVLHEVQTCELVKYLCQFDPNVLPLLGLVNYWARLNSLSFGSMRVTNPFKRAIAPLPASLDWLVLLFLISRKVIPSVRDVLSRPHDEIIVCDKDIGFSSDPEFPRAWSSMSTPPLQINEQIERIRNTENEDVYSVNKIFEVLEILREFFAFYGDCRYKRIRKRKVLLNPKDGKIIKKSAIVNSGEKCAASVNLSEEEMKTLKEMLCSTDHHVWILHPINLRFSLSFCGRRFSYMLTHAMVHSSKKIGQFFRSLRKKNVEGSHVNLIKLLKFRVDEIYKKNVKKGGRVFNGKRRTKKTKNKKGSQLTTKKKKGKDLKKVKTLKKRVSTKKGTVSS